MYVAIFTKHLILVHNQAMRLITGGTKSTPIDALLLLTGNSPLDAIINEKHYSSMRKYFESQMKISGPITRQRITY